MPLDERSRHRSSRHPAAHTYFVGRRQFDAAEVYAVSPADVQQLRSDREYGERTLDWHGSSRAGMELSHALLSKVAELRPSRDLDERFALYVLAQLPDDGLCWMRTKSGAGCGYRATHKTSRPATLSDTRGPGDFAHCFAGPMFTPPVTDRPLRSAAGRSPGSERRAADRHYLAVVATEARRLARQLRSPVARSGSDAPRGDRTVTASPRPAEAAH